MQKASGLRCRHLRELQDPASMSIFQYAQLAFDKKGVMDTVACRLGVVGTHRCWMRCEESTLSVYNTLHHIVYSWFRSIEDANGFRIPF